MSRDFLVIAVCSLVSAGCSDTPRHVDSVAWTGNHRLSVDRLADVLVLAQPMPLRTDVAVELARHWIHVTALTDRLAAGDNLLDPSWVRAAMWLPVRQQLTQDYLSTIERGGGADLRAVYQQSILRESGVEFVPAAADIVRETAADPEARGDERTLASYDGGRFTTGELRRYLLYLSPETRREIRTAADTEIMGFLVQLVGQELVWHRVKSAGLTLGDSASAAIEAQYRSAVEAIQTVTGVTSAWLITAGADPEARGRAAARRVDEYLERAAARMVPLQPVPPFLTVPLLEGTTWGIDSTAVDAAVARARRMLDATVDTTATLPGPS